jgi:hypothetical protein
MKKNIVLLLVALISSISFLNAQQFALGVKGGANMTKINGSSFEEKFEYGYHAGGFAKIKLTNRLYIQPEVMLSQINTTVDSNFKNLYNSLLDANYVKNIQLKYLTIPLVLNYKLGGFVDLQGGVQYAKLLESGKTLLQNGESAFKDGDFSALAGVQFNIRKLVISGRYLIGLNNINDIDNRDQWKNQTAQISVGFRL